MCNFKEPETAKATPKDDEGEGFESPELTDYQEAAVRHPGFSRGKKINRSEQGSQSAYRP